MTKKILAALAVLAATAAPTDAQMAPSAAAQGTQIDGSWHDGRTVRKPPRERKP